MSFNGSCTHGGEAKDNVRCDRHVGYGKGQLELTLSRVVLEKPVEARLPTCELGAIVVRF